MDNFLTATLRQRIALVLRLGLRIGFALVLCIAFLLLVLLIGSTGNSARLAEQFDILLLLNGVVALGLFIWVFIMGFSLWRRIRHKQFGTHLSAKLAFFFSVIAIVPGIIIYTLSAQFMSRSVESWFNVKVDSALEAGIALGKASLDAMTADMLTRAREIASQLSNVPDADLPEALNFFRDNSTQIDALIFSGNGSKALAYSSSLFGSLLPQMPPSSVLTQLRLARQYAQVELMNEATSLQSLNAPEQYQIRVIVPIFSSLRRRDASLIGAPEPHWLQFTRPVPDQVANNLSEVQQGFRNYEELALSRVGIRELFSLSLTMALLLTVFTSLGIALWIARRLVERLLLLAEGTQAVAVGQYRPIPGETSRDEVGTLTRSFNHMIVQLQEAQQQVQNHRENLERSNLYLESILTSLSSGVLVMDAHLNIQMMNPGAAKLLQQNLVTGNGLSDYPALQDFAQRIKQAFVSHQAVQSPRPYWQAQIELLRPESEGSGAEAQATVTLLVRGMRLMGSSASYLLVFDDISDILSVNRARAWGEVARRLAHEIKNPLTPIQLSAERIQMKLSPKLATDDAAFLDRLTRTIVDQVFSLKSMVDDFREYARMPATHFQPVNLNDLIRDMAVLYGWNPEGQQEGPLYRQMQLDLDDQLPLVKADPSQWRQLLNNLLSNARDAMEGQTLSGQSPGVCIQTRCLESAEGPCVLITISDRGPGFSAKILKNAFEPYITTKAHGTGLGLPIVRKIVEEHGGSIELSNRPEGGAKVSILLLLKREYW